MNALESAKIDLKHARAHLQNAGTREEAKRRAVWFNECKERVEQLEKGKD